MLGGKIEGAGQRVVLYGAGGIGKSELCSLAPKPIFLDIDDGTHELDVQRIEGIQTFADLRAVLQSNALDPYQTIILDNATRAEELGVTHTLATVRGEKGQTCRSVEDYGFGKGYQHVYETFLLLLADLDSQVRRGRHVVLIAHECTDAVPNPVGEDYIRFAPQLQAPKSGKASIRNRVVQWADHVLFLAYDVIAEGGKGRGSGTRTIYPRELPSHLAKSRILADPVAYPKGDGSVWSKILGGAK